MVMQVSDETEVMKLMVDEGTILLQRMNDRVESLKSKNIDLFTTMLAVISIAAGGLSYAVDVSWIPIEHLLLSFMFFLPIGYAAVLSYFQMMPRRYPELRVYDVPDLDIILDAPYQKVLSHLIFVRQTTLAEIERRYETDMKRHIHSIGWFSVSFFGLLALFIIELMI